MKPIKLRWAAAIIAVLLQAMICVKGHYDYADDYLSPVKISVLAVGEKSGDGISWTGFDLKKKQSISGDTRFQINFRPDIPCYVKLIYSDEDGGQKVLYDAKKLFMALKKGKSYTLPSPDLWYELQDVGNKESVSLIVSSNYFSRETPVNMENGKMGKKGGEVAVPLSDGALFKTNWKDYEAKGNLKITWSFSKN